MRHLMKNFIFYLILCLLSTSCVTGKLYVDSTPNNSKVFVRAAGASKSESIGQSPISRDISDVKKVANGASTIVVEVRKEGYLPRSVIVTDIDSVSDVKVNLELASVEEFVKGSDPSLSEAQKRILASLNEKKNLQTNQLIDELFEAQRLTQVGRTQDAERKLDELEKRFPNVATIYEIRGGIAFMKKDYPKALDAFRKAARANPQNVEVLNLKKYLEKKLNINGQEFSEAGR